MVAFVPVAITRTHTATFDASPDEMFALMNPAEGNHWVLGLPPDGNAAVQGFFDTHWNGRMARLEQSYRDLLGRSG